MTDLVHTPDSTALLVQIDCARTALAEARDDFERLRIRDAAAAVHAAAEVLGRRDVQIVAAELVADAERTIAHAHPPQKGGRGKTVAPGAGVSPDALSRMRRAHPETETDEQWELVKAEHRERDVPITRAALIERHKPKPHVSHATGMPHWNTPPDLLALARRALRVEQFDFDPASNVKGQRNVQARRYLTERHDALNPDTPWHGPTVWLNPPYRSDLYAGFAKRLLEEMEHGPVERAVWLSNNNTETVPSACLLAVASAVCFPTGRVKFLDAGHATVGAPLQGQMLIGLGDVDFSVFLSTGPVFRSFR